MTRCEEVEKGVLSYNSNGSRGNKQNYDHNNHGRKYHTINKMFLGFLIF